MIKKRKNLIIIFLIILLEIFILFNPNILITYSKDAINLFINKLFISLFPFFVLNKILINYNFPYYISKLKNSNIYLSIIILSMLSGMPSNAEYIKDYLDKKIITLKEAEKLLIITFFPSPVFVITVIGYLGFNSIYIGMALLLIIYLTNFLIFIIIKDKNKYTINLNIKNNKSFMKVLKESISSSFDSLMIILGNIVIFSILAGIIINYLNTNLYIEIVLTSLLELSNGIKKISELITNFNIKFSLCVFSLIFSGISIHFQISSILSKYNINFFKVFLYRLVISIIISITSYIILLSFSY